MMDVWIRHSVVCLVVDILDRFAVSPIEAPLDDLPVLVASNP
jgi:hypothetical protein